MQNPPEMKKLLAIFQLKTARKTFFFYHYYKADRVSLTPPGYSSFYYNSSVLI